MSKEELWSDMGLVAAAGSVSFVELSDERAIDAAQAIIDHAPESIQDDFKRCCVYHVYRDLLMKAQASEDVGQMYAAQSALIQFLND